MSESKRLFVGIRVSVATANALAGAAETLARRARDAKLDIKWVAPVNYHVTMKFLGSTRVEAITAIRDALDEAATGISRMTLRCARLGAFGSLDKARVLWAGIEDSSGQLDKLAKQIEAACARLGHADPRPFHAHVTLGRLRETRPVREVVLPLAEQMFGDTKVDSMTLFESETKPTGSVYRELQRIAFKTAENTASGRAERQTGALHLGARSESRVGDAESVEGASSADLDTDDGWPRGHSPNT
ncbi:MAG TPA: RNA 2',3'-cyclic phosphodiesterase [Kofleriaceae bacterium]|nr:RNA 2',3'-cyclic phosphodiesterase [Kofleriaceae bacterium]